MKISSKAYVETDARSLVHHSDTISILSSDSPYLFVYWALFNICSKFEFVSNILLKFTKLDQKRVHTAVPGHVTK